MNPPRFSTLALALALAALATASPARAQAVSDDPPFPPDAADQDLDTPDATEQGPPIPSAPPPAVVPDDPLTTIQLPNNTVQEVASFYELLTGKRMILDSDLSGPNLSIVVSEPLPKSEAVALIEAALLLNQFHVVPVDDKTVKLLGRSKQPRSEGIPLYTEPWQLPDSDTVVSYFMPFRYIKSQDAFAVFQQYVTIRPFGSIVPVPNVNAVVITENVPLVRRLIELKRVIDVQGSRRVTEFFQLTRADAERVAEILTKLFEGDGAAASSPAAGPEAAAVTPAGEDSPVALESVPRQPEPGGGQRLVPEAPPPIQVVADIRTNRLMITGPEDRMAFVEEIVRNLDMAVIFEEPLERELQFASARDVLPVLANMLSESKDEAQQIVGGDGSGAGGGDGGLRADTGGGLGGTTGGGGSVPDRLRDPSDSTAPLSVIVGKSRIIADPSANTIIVIGPPESRTKAASVLAMLDKRPRQIFLATVIGQLSLGDDLEFGVDFLVKFDGFRFLGSGGAGTITDLIRSRNGSVDVIPGTEDIVDTATEVARQAIPILSGLTVYGTVGDTFDFLVRALEQSNRFQVISRPTVYTANNKKAVISSGQQVPVPTQTLSSAVTASASDLGTSITSNIDFKDVVLKLEVIPLINSENEVTLTIFQTNNTIVGRETVSNNQVPIIGTQELTTTVTVPNRQTVILGGLITDVEDRSQVGIPFLKDIPGLGYFFGTTRKLIQRRELIVMIQPFIIDSDEALKAVNYIERANISMREGLFDESLPVKRAELPTPEDYQTPARRRGIFW